MSETCAHDGPMFVIAYNFVRSMKRLACHVVRTMAGTFVRIHETAMGTNVAPSYAKGKHTSTKIKNNKGVTYINTCF